ncbi:unnamed protein product [Urochloa decumbens]|uniref:Uncharacterized protein n=1 Tax=Urochloa decumbens TaxID=240449 RepID=A0ABC9CZB9_9POAL
MLVAASSVRVVAGANEQAAACSISDEDVGSVVERVRNYRQGVQGDGVPGEADGGRRLPQLGRRRWLGRGEGPELYRGYRQGVQGDGVPGEADGGRRLPVRAPPPRAEAVRHRPPDIARCKPTCVIAERTVEYAAEVIKSGTDFKKQVLCDNTVQRALDVGDDCFCEFRSRVQAKVGGSSIDGALCGLTEKTSQCRRAACGIQDGDVQYCANALVESRDTNQEALAPMIGGPSQSEPPVVAISPPAMSPFLESLVHGCCSKVSKLSAACACEFNDALQKKVGNGTDHLTTVLPCMATTDDCTLA